MKKNHREKSGIEKEPEIESTNCPLMKSLVNLMGGIVKEEGWWPLERPAMFVCRSNTRRDKTITKAMFDPKKRKVPLLYTPQTLR